MTIPKSEWEWFGGVGHLIVGHDCRFHLTTRVGMFFVSTVGEYLPGEGVREITAQVRSITLHGRGDERRADYMKRVGYLEIGAGRLYETMVFKAGPPCNAAGCDCGMPLPQDYQELDMAGYNTAGAARVGHYALCDKWATVETAGTQYDPDAGD